MNKKVTCLLIIALFSLSVLPIGLAAETQMAPPIKVTQEIGSAADSVLADSTNILFVKTNPNNVDQIVKPQAKPAPQPKSYALNLEIDYIEGHAPTQSALDYMQSYYAKKGITITYTIGQAIPNLENYADGISDTEFWAIEYAYNDGPTKAASSSAGVYTSPYKWVLYGTTVEGSANTVGYTYCVGNSRDLVAGNYIYIADQAADDWAVSTTIQVSPSGAETVVLMHEFGHSIGICVVRAGSEVYCNDYYCVMSYLRSENAGNIGNWYYCSSHWKTVNLGYYVV